jgi:hypothetical protein
MSPPDVAPASRLPSDEEQARRLRYLQRSQWRQLGLITGGAIALFVGLRLLPTGTNLSHMDFRVDPKAGNAIEFCDPLNPQFISVVAMKSPVAMTVVPKAPIVSGHAAEAVVTLRTASGKAIAPDDLQVMHTRKLHLLVIDPTLTDYQHVHPEPSRMAGEWTFTFTPRVSGAYRVFADFTPAATSRGLYASADVDVGPALAAVPGERPANDRRPSTVDRDGIRFTLAPSAKPIRAGQPVDLKFSMQRADGGAVALEPVMDAFAHLVAFDQARSGFAHLHPAEDPLTKPDARGPELNFKLTIPNAGRYVIWAQVKIAGREVFVPFWFDVV